MLVIIGKPTTKSNQTPSSLVKAIKNAGSASFSTEIGSLRDFQLGQLQSSDRVLRAVVTLI